MTYRHIIYQLCVNENKISNYGCIVFFIIIFVFEFPQRFSNLVSALIRHSDNANGTIIVFFDTEKCRLTLVRFLNQNSWSLLLTREVNHSITTGSIWQNRRLVTDVTSVVRIDLKKFCWLRHGRFIVLMERLIRKVNEVDLLPLYQKLNNITIKRRWLWQIAQFGWHLFRLERELRFENKSFKSINEDKTKKNRMKCLYAYLDNVYFLQAINFQCFPYVHMNVCII